MKRTVLLLLVVAGAYGLWRRVQEDREDRDLWAEVTDTLD